MGNYRFHVRSIHKFRQVNFGVSEEMLAFKEFQTFQHLVNLLQDLYLRIQFTLNGL